jgi:hypothetical protein
MFVMSNMLVLFGQFYVKQYAKKPEPVAAGTPGRVTRSAKKAL